MNKYPHNYSLQKENNLVRVNEMLDQENMFFIEELKRKEQTEITIITIGNSIAAGYSMTSPIVPLFKRNNNLENICKENNINLKVYSRASAYRNNEKIMHNRLLDASNNTISFYVEQTKDYFSGKRLIIEHSETKENLITPQQLSYYYTEELTENKSLRSIIEDRSTQPIIVYSPCTGGIIDVTDHIPKNETSVKGILKGFFDDLAYFNKNLSIIETLNPNACVIVMPILKNSKNILYSTAIEYANGRIKKVTDHYPNVYCMPSFSFSYPKINNSKEDVHPNELEYQKLLVHLMHTISSILPSHLDNKKIINIINEFVDNHELDYTADQSNKIEISELENRINIIEETIDNKNETYQNVNNYINDNYPSFYVHMPKNSINEFLEEKIKNK